VAACHTQHGNHGAGPAWTWPLVSNGSFVVTGPRLNFTVILWLLRCSGAYMCTHGLVLQPVQMETASCRCCLR
jgi:hypothetical protein